METDAPLKLLTVYKTIQFIKQNLYTRALDDGYAHDLGVGAKEDDSKTDLHGKDSCKSLKHAHSITSKTMDFWIYCTVLHVAMKSNSDNFQYGKT